MLRELVIKNFAIIDASTLSFSEGLNVLSGETGAGKSIIVNAINLIQGKRTSGGIIRNDEEEATVEALFDISDNYMILDKMESLGVEREETLVIKRVVSNSGRNKVFINGGLATLSMLASIGDDLITVSGQHEHQLLLNTERHIDILDDFGGLISLRQGVETLFGRLLKLSRELADHTVTANRRLERESLLDFQYHEIERANLQVGEYEDLRNEKKILVNSEKLLQYSNHGYNAIYGAKGSVIECLEEVRKNMKEICSIDSSLNRLHDGIESSIIELEDIALVLRDYAQKTEFDPARFEAVELRLAELNKLKKKYGPTIEEILQYRDKIRRELEDISQGGHALTHLKDKICDLEREIMGLTRDLSEKRKTTAEKMKAGIERELRSIGMEGTVFEVDIRNARVTDKSRLDGNIDVGDYKISRKGIDDVEFLLSPNPGEPPRALSKVASGGELSRIVLAIKSILAREGGVETLIFDEVDAGIGGRTADVVGQKLKSASRFHQVICITHLPQIAKFADTHYSIRKRLKDGRTYTSVRRLDKEGRVDEITRMLAGVKITDTVREHAREMIEKA